MHEPPQVSKMVGIKINRGQHLRLETPGGGGYGDPFERDPDAILSDIKDGYVSVESAKHQYGVIIDQNGDIDHAQTAVCRKGSES